MPADRTRAWAGRPLNFDELWIFVVRDVHGGKSSLLCGDGVWREYDPFEELGRGDLTPTVRISGMEVCESTVTVETLIRRRMPDKSLVDKALAAYFAASNTRS